MISFWSLLVSAKYLSDTYLLMSNPSPTSISLRAHSIYLGLSVFNWLLVKDYVVLLTLTLLLILLSSAPSDSPPPSD